MRHALSLKLRVLHPLTSTYMPKLRAACNIAIEPIKSEVFLSGAAKLGTQPRNYADSALASLCPEMVPRILKYYKTNIHYKKDVVWMSKNDEAIANELKAKIGDYLILS